MRKTGRYVLACAMLFVAAIVQGQATYPENGVADPRHGYYAFTNATIVKDAQTTLSNATLVVKDGKIMQIHLSFLH
jgi:hypothetical protein